MRKKPCKVGERVSEEHAQSDAYDVIKVLFIVVFVRLSEYNINIVGK